MWRDLVYIPLVALSVGSRALCGSLWNGVCAAIREKHLLRADPGCNVNHLLPVSGAIALGIKMA